MAYLLKLQNDRLVWGKENQYLITKPSLVTKKLYFITFAVQ